MELNKDKYNNNFFNKIENFFKLNRLNTLANSELDEGIGEENI